MHMFARKFLTALGIITLLPSISYATNGTFLIGTGAKIRSMGGAGVALPTSSLSLAINPAHAAHLGIRADLDGMLFVPRRKACTRAAPECAVSGANLFFLPSMGGAYKFNRKIGMGFVGYAAGGGSTRYDRDIFTSPGPLQTTGADVKQMIMAPSFAYKMDKQLSIGIAPLIAIQQFRAYGLNNFQTTAISSDIANVTNNGNDWSYGAGIRLGFLGQFYKKKFSVGASYSSRIYMSELDKYRGLLSPNGEFDIPENYTVGIAVKPMDKLTIAFDITRIMNSDVQALGNPISNTIGTAANPTVGTEPKLGEQGGGGFGWDDQTVYKLGFAYDWDKKLTLNFGANYGESPIPEDDSLLPGAVAPATVEWHATVGLDYKITKKSEIALTYVHAFKKELSNFNSGQFPISPGGGATIEMVQNSGSLTYSFLF